MARRGSATRQRSRPDGRSDSTRKRVESRGDGDGRFDVRHSSTTESELATATATAAAAAAAAAADDEALDDESADSLESSSTAAIRAMRERVPTPGPRRTSSANQPGSTGTTPTSRRPRAAAVRLGQPAGLDRDDTEVLSSSFFYRIRQAAPICPFT